MKKYHQLLLLLILILFCGCAAIFYTQQKIENTYLLKPGLSKDEVIKIMGTPCKTEFSENKSAWHYCKTGETADEFVVLVFDGDKLLIVKNYSVTLRDTGGATGDCSKFVRPYDFEKPDETKEIRLKDVPSH
jgi:outer membrane protein assembly factor BamE (lipoprotein component of BamABCDE complex)